MSTEETKVEVLKLFKYFGKKNKKLGDLMDRISRISDSLEKKRHRKVILEQLVGGIEATKKELDENVRTTERLRSQPDRITERTAVVGRNAHLLEGNYDLLRSGKTLRYELELIRKSIAEDEKSLSEAKEFVLAMVRAGRNESSS